MKPKTIDEAISNIVKVFGPCLVKDDSGIRLVRK